MVSIPAVNTFTIAGMKKTRAIQLLGGTPKKAAAAMGYRAVQTIYLWPETLPQSTADRVTGVVARLKAIKAINAGKHVTDLRPDAAASAPAAPQSAAP